MTKEQLIEKLRSLPQMDDARVVGDTDWDDGHEMADKALLEYINDPDISAAFEAVGRWYA